MLTGELGTLNRDGRQVGGVLDWRIDALLDSTGRSGWRTIERRSFKVRVRKYWVLEKLEGDKFHAIFYQFIRGGLVVVTQHDVTVDIPDSPLDMIIPGRLEMWRG